MYFCGIAISTVVCDTHLMALPSPLRLLLQKQQKPAAIQFERMFSLKDAARLLGIGTLALRRATKKNPPLIHSVRLHPRGHIKFRESELRKFLEPKTNDEK
jgi:hypothetical protein